MFSAYVTPTPDGTAFIAGITHVKGIDETTLYTALFRNRETANAWADNETQLLNTIDELVTF